MKEPRVVRTFEEAREAYAGEERLALDLETSGFSAWNDRIHVIALYGAASDTIAILHYPKGVPVPQAHMDWLSEFPEIVWHNGTQFDGLFLANAGFDWRKPKLYDTLIGEQATLEVARKDIRVNLADSVKRRLGKVVDKSIDHGRWGNAILDENQLAYVTGDIRYILELRRKQLERTATRGTLGCVEFEMELSKPTLEMVLHGLPVDLEALQTYFEGREARFLENDAYLHSVLGEETLLSSFPQLRAKLAELYGPRAFPDTKAERLMRAAQGSGEQARVAQALLDWRHYRQRQNMFGEEWQRKYVVASPTGHRVHGKFWQLGTNTGRYASSEPNLQQVPSDMKACYGGHEGLVIGKSDFSGLEIRVAASIAEDAALVEAFNNGEDIHRLVASAGFGKPIDEITSEERKIAKAMSFTWLFGGSVQTFMDYASANGSHVDWETANRAYVNFFRRFEGLSDFRNQAHLICNTKRAFVLRYPTGLKRLLEGRELIPTILLNNYVQGYAAAGMKYAILEAHRRGISPYLCATVHDELVYAAPQEQIVDLTREIQECMVLGMKEALRDGSNISIAVESTWGPTWVGLPENVTHYEE